MPDKEFCKVKLAKLIYDLRKKHRTWKRLIMRIKRINFSSQQLSTIKDNSRSQITQIEQIDWNNKNKLNV